MRLTEIHVQPANDPDHMRLLAYVRVVFDDELAVYGMRLVQLQDRMHVEFPSRKVKWPCGVCRSAQPCDQRYCAACGARLDRDGRRACVVAGGGQLQVNVAFPISEGLRRRVTSAVVAEYERIVAGGGKGPLAAQAGSRADGQA